MTDASATKPALARPALRLRVEKRLQRAMPAPAFQIAVGGYYRARKLVRRGASRGRLLPDFVIIGAAKAGTTSLFGKLSEHPFVVPASVKEVHYFDYHYYRGEDWYRRHFPTSMQRAAFAAEHGMPFMTGEASPSYIAHDFAPLRIAGRIPDVKIVVSLRNPVDRAYSQFQMRRRDGDEPLESFAEAVAAEGGRLAGELARAKADRRYISQALADWSYLKRGRYAEQLERWFALFAREQLHVLTLEDLSSDPQGTLDGVHEFLGLPIHHYERFERLNWIRGSMQQSTAAYDPIETETRAQLTEYFRPHNERLYELLDRDFGWERGSAIDRQGDSALPSGSSR
jgi:hypothetical protein